MVCIPFFLDQFSHCRTLSEKLEMGVTVNSNNLNSETFSQAVKEVLSNPKYAANAKKTKYIISDTPMKGKDLFLYWVNYTIRHKGAMHLVSDPPHEMSILQYWSVDVVAFLILTPLLGLLFLVRMIKFVCCRSSAAKKKRE